MCLGLGLFASLISVISEAAYFPGGFEVLLFFKFSVLHPHPSTSWSRTYGPKTVK